MEIMVDAKLCKFFEAIFESLGADSWVRIPNPKDASLSPAQLTDSVTGGIQTFPKRKPHPVPASVGKQLTTLLSQPLHWLLH